MVRIEVVKKTLKASTLHEVIIAMVILMLVTGFGLMTFINISRYAQTVRPLRAQAALQDILVKIETRGLPAENTVTYSGGFKIMIQKEETNQPEGLILLKLTSYDTNGLRTGQLKKIIPGDR